jgi:hypothetical protein
LIHRDDHARRAGVGFAEVHDLSMRLGQDRGQPFALDVEGSSQALARQRAADIVFEARGMGRAVGRSPFHLAADPREVDRPNDPPIAKRFAIAVFVVRMGFLAHVAYEGNRALIRSEGCSRHAEADGRQLEGVSDSVAPGATVRGVMDLVEDDERLADESPQCPWVRGDLLVGDGDTVHVRWQGPVACRPVGVEMNVEFLGGQGPLQLEVLRGDDNDATPDFARNERAPNRSETLAIASVVSSWGRSEPLLGT